jgi:CRP-like cAMP-binding protein
MLMSTTINRIRLTVATLSIGNTLSGEDRWREYCVFDRGSRSALVRELGDRIPLYAPRRKTIMSEGEAGVFMYVVLEGTVAISIKGKVVEKVGPGGVFGEMALIDKSPRTATAAVESDCSLLTINRTDFLALVKTRPDFAMSVLRALADRLRFLTSKYG